MRFESDFWVSANEIISLIERWQERDFIPLVVSKANVDGTKFATATKGGHGHLPDLDEESNAAFILNLFYWKGTGPPSLFSLYRLPRL